MGTAITKFHGLLIKILLIENEAEINLLFKIDFLNNRNRLL